MTGISRRGVLGAGALGVAGVLSGTTGSAHAGPTPSFGLRIREVDYTPQLGEPGLVMGGFGWDRRVNNGTAARKLRAQCVQLSHGNNHVILLRVDVVSIPSEVFKQIRQGLLTRGLIQAEEQFLLGSSHTHSGPMVGHRPDPYVLQGSTGSDFDSVTQFTDVFVDTMIELVRETLMPPPVQVTLGYAEGLGFLAANRSNAPATPPPDVPVLLARHAGTGIPAAVMFGHACHPVCRGKDTVFDSDHCGYAAEMISNRLGIPALFLQGAAGDLNPLGGRDLPMTGGGLADAVVAMVRNGAFYPLTGPITASRQELMLPLNVDDDGIDELRGKFEARLSSGSVHVRRHAERMVQLIDSGTLPRHMPMMVQVWRLGGLRIIAMANEVTSTYHHMAKTMASGPSWVTGYANWVDGYVPGDQLLNNGGYEAGWQGDRGIAGEDTAGVSYSWPAPLRPSEAAVRAAIALCL